MRYTNHTRTLLSITGFVFAFVFLLPLSAPAQTPVWTLENSSNDVVLQSFDDGGLLAPKQSSGSGAIPAQGTGTRMMWYPDKAAFRAGAVGVFTSGNEWDDANVGFKSVAFGGDTKASGNFSTAMGKGTIASGTRGTAMGNDTKASDFAATAMGSQATASGQAATAIGNGTIASSSHAAAMGKDTEASGTGATAMGFQTTAISAAAVAMGSNTEASGNFSTAMGSGTVASSSAAVAMGRATTAATDNSLSIGKFNSANTSDDGTLFVVGNGSSGSRRDALVLDELGNLEIDGTLTENSNSSDRRLKTGIEPLGDGSLKKLGRLHPVRFEFRDQESYPSGKQIGLIAQDVRTEFPALVSKGSEGYLSLAYPKFTAVLLKGLQEQQTQIDSLRDRVREVKTLQKRVARLEAQSPSGSRLAGVPGSGLLAILLAVAGFGAGLLWRRRS